MGREPAGREPAGRDQAGRDRAGADRAVLIRGGRVIDPASGLDRVCDVAIAGGTIVEIGDQLSKTPAASVIEADGLLVTPGLIDPHVHLREPGGEQAETIASGARAAAAGGFTTVCCMPNTRPALDTPEMLHAIAHKASGADCRVFPVAAATVGREGKRATEFRLLAEAGAVGFTDDGDAIASAGVMLDALRRCVEVDRVFMQHCQEPTLTAGASMHAGSVSVELGLGGWPRVAEEIIIERDIRLAGVTGARYHIQHMSCGSSVEIVRRAREAGLRVSAEVSPHHLTLTHEACRGFETSAKMNPPLRERSDIDALKEGVARGVITVLATDHAPHSDEAKGQDFARAPFGIIGLETALGVYAEALVYGNVIGWDRLVAMMTIEPAGLCGLDAQGLGRLTPGGPADITLIDPGAAWVVGAGDLAGKSRNTPFLGRALVGRAVGALLGGRMTMDRLEPSRCARA